MSATVSALKSPRVLQPVFAGFSILSPSWLWIVMPVLFLIVAAACWAASGGRMLQVRRVPPWRSATAGVKGHDSYTAFGFANPTRRVLAAVLHTKAEVRQMDRSMDRELDMRGPDSGPGRGGLPAGTPPAAGQDARLAPQVPHVGYSSDVIEVVEEYLYRPVLRPLAALGRAARRLQSGRLDAYPGYMLIALIAMLAVVTALS